MQQARSARATGSWTPDSRIALPGPAGPQFGDVWEQMARTSWKQWRSWLGLPGNPVCFSDRYTMSDVPFAQMAEESEKLNTMGFAEYGGRIVDLTGRSQVLPAGAVPFPVPYVRRSSNLQFNIHDLAHQMLNDFRLAGGRIVMREFHEPREIAALPQKVVINCTGYGARALRKDESIVPVRGQIGWLIPQPEVNFGLFYRDGSVLSRTDGIVVQAIEGGDLKGYNDDREVIDRDESVHAVKVIEDLYARMA